jgi:hypothetical protein
LELSSLSRGPEIFISDQQAAVASLWRALALSLSNTKELAATQALRSRATVQLNLRIRQAALEKICNKPGLVLS